MTNPPWWLEKSPKRPQLDFNGDRGKHAEKRPKNDSLRVLDMNELDSDGLSDEDLDEFLGPDVVRSLDTLENIRKKIDFVLAWDNTLTLNEGNESTATITEGNEPTAPLQRTSLYNEAKAAFKEGDNATKFVLANAQPRSQLERFALDVFWFHTQRCGLTSELLSFSGAEYWVQIRDRERGDDVQPIDFHFDKDEQLADEHGGFVFPLVATATYLSDVGAPIVILDNPVVKSRSLPFPHGEASSAALIHPKRARHVAFCGNRVHGCPTSLSSTPLDGERISILVNLWISYVPVEFQSQIDAAPAWKSNIQPLARSTESHFIADATTPCLDLTKIDKPCDTVIEGELDGFWNHKFKAPKDSATGIFALRIHVQVDEDSESESEWF